MEENQPIKKRTAPHYGAVRRQPEAAEVVRYKRSAVDAGDPSALLEIPYRDLVLVDRSRDPGIAAQVDGVNCTVVPS